MPELDIERSFRAELERIHASASRRGLPALKAPLKSKLLTLLSVYRLKLKPIVYQAALLEAGDLLLELQEYDAARIECYEAITELAASDSLAASGQQALTQRARAEFGAVECAFLVLVARDATLLKSSSATALSALLDRSRAAMALCVAHEALYWVVFNGSVLCYRLCQPALTAARASITIETLAYCALALEGMLPLLQTRFLGWRVRVYTALCHAYEAIGSVGGAKRAADHAVGCIEDISRLMQHDPVPPTKRVGERIAAATRTLHALQLKYSGASALGAPVQQLLGDAAAHQIMALIELTLDHSASARRVFAPVPAPPRQGEAEAARAALAQDALAAALSIADPLVERMAAPAKLAEARAAAEEVDAATRAAAAAAGAEAGDAKAPEAEDAAAAEEAEAAVAAAAAEAAAEAAAKDGAAAAAQLPLSVQMDLVRELFRAHQWEAVDRLLPPSLARAAAGLDTASALAASASALAVTAKDSALGFGNSMAATPTAADPTEALEDGGDQADSTPEFPVGPASGADDTVVWAELRLMQLVRALDLAQADGTSADILSAASNLARLLEACRSRPLSAAVDLRPDVFGDAALRLWSVATTALAAADEADAAQSALGPPAAPQALGHLTLSARLRPKTKADGSRLAAALAQLVARDSSLSYTLSPDGSAFLSGRGELQLRVACDILAKDLKIGKEQGIDVGAVLAPSKRRRSADGAATFTRRLSTAGAGLDQTGETGAEAGGAGAVDVAALHETLRAAYWTVTHSGLRDPQLRATIGLRLAAVQFDQGAHSEAVSTCRHAIAEVTDARGAMLVDLAEAGITDVPSATAATVLQSLEAAAPYSSSKDGLQQALGCLHTDLFVWLFRAELAHALEKSEAASRRKFETTRAAQLKRRSQRHIYGRQWEADRKREEAEDAAPVQVPSHSAAREAQLLAEFEQYPQAKAMLLLEMAAYRQSAKERAGLIGLAADALEYAAKQEEQALEASAPHLPDSGPTSLPPPPQLIYRTATSMCVRPRAYTPLKGAKVESCAVFAKVAAAGISVSTNNTEYLGSNERVPMKPQATSIEFQRGCITLRGLPPATSIVFAAAGYAADGKMIGSIGRTSVEVLTSLPLPRALAWGYVGRAAAQLNAKTVAHRAIAEILATFIDKGEPLEAWEQSPMLSWRLSVRAIAHSAPAELRTAAQACLLEAYLRAPTLVEDARGHSAAQDQLGVLSRARLEVLALQLALAAGDDALTASAAQATFHSLIPLLRAGQRSSFLIQPLAACLAALSLLPRAALGSIQSASVLLARLGYEASQLAIEVRLPSLAVQLSATASKLLTPDEGHDVTGKPLGAGDVLEPEGTLVYRLFGEWLSSRAEFQAAGTGMVGGSPGFKICSALSRSADEAAPLLGALEADVRHFEFTVQVCASRLAANPTPEAVVAVREALARASEVSRGASSFEPLSKRVSSARDAATAIEPAASQPADGDEAVVEAMRAQHGTTLAALVRAMWLFVKARGTARAHHAATLPWRAQSKLLLARCAAISPNAAPELPVRDDTPESAQGEVVPPSDHAETASHSSLLEGLDVLVECARASTLALRAHCPMVVLQATAMLSNYYSGLHAAALAASAFGGFDELPRPRGQKNPPDPPSAIPQQLWRILLQGAESVLGLLAWMREGYPLGGIDKMSRALAGAAAPDPDDAPSEADENESLAFGTRGWFERRETARDTASLDFAWVLGTVRYALRALQLARQWRRQERLALSFDAITDGKYSLEVLPFVAQAQQKLHGTKWADGESTPAVLQRVVEAARNTSACKTSLEECRKMRHQVITPGSSAGTFLEIEVVTPVIRAYAECVSLCRTRGEDAMLIEALIELGELHLRAGQAKRAAELWRQALDSTFGRLDVMLQWRDMLEGDHAAPEPALDRFGAKVCVRALALCCALAVHSSRRDLEARLEYALFGAALARALFHGSVAHPSRNIAFAGFRLHELWPGAEPFEPYVYTTLRVLDGLQGSAAILLEYEMGLAALPMLSLYKHLSTDVCREARHSLAADVLTAEALTATGQIQHAIDALAAAYNGADLPKNSLELAPAPVIRIPPPAFQTHEPPDTKANALAVAALVGLAPAPHMIAFFDSSMLLARLDLARVSLLLRLSQGSPALTLSTALVGVGGVLLTACEEKLAAVASAVASKQLQWSVDVEAGDKPTATGPQSEVLAAITCQALTLHSKLLTRKGLTTAAVAALREAMAAAQAAGAAVQPTGSFKVPPVMQLSPVTWLSVRYQLANAALTQGQLTACDEQLQIGITEAQAANDGVMRQKLVLTQQLLYAERGELQGAISGLEAWLATGMGEADILLMQTAAAAMHVAGLKVGVSTLAGYAADAARGVGAAVVILQHAVEKLSASAVEHGLPSSERWPCLEQSVTSGAAKSEDRASLRNVYLPQVPVLLRARVMLGEALASLQGAEMAAKAAEELSAAAELLPNTLASPPSVVARLHAVLGRLARERAQLFYSPTSVASTPWGGVLTSAKASLTPEQTVALDGAAGVACRHLLDALALSTRDGPVDLQLQASILLDLALLHGAKLADGCEDFHVNLAAAYVLAAASANRARHSMFVELPSLAAVPLAAALPQLLTEMLNESRAIIAATPGAVVPPDPSATVSRQLLHLLSSMMRRQSAPKLDEEAHERAILLLQAFLKQHCPPFVAALPPAVPHREDFVADIKPGLVCVQWCVADPPPPCRASGASHIPRYFLGAPQLCCACVERPSPIARRISSRPAETGITMLYVLHRPSEAGDGLAVGSRALPAAAVRQLAATILDALRKQAEPSTMPLAAKSTSSSVKEVVAATASAVASVILEARGAFPPVPPPAVAEPRAQLDEKVLGHLAAIFNVPTGGLVHDEQLCAWLHQMLEGEAGAKDVGTDE